MGATHFSGPLNVANNVQAGLSGTAGTVISFPATAAKGSLILKAVANTGNTNTTISNAAMGQATVVSIPDPGAATANFVLDAGTQTIAGARTFSSAVAITPTTNQLVLGAAAHLTTVSATAPAAATQVVTVPDSGAATTNVVLDAGVTTMAASSRIKFDSGTGTCSSNAVTISKQAGIVTTESLSTAGGASQAITITNTLVGTTSNIMVTEMGGTNTTSNFSLVAVPTSNTITVTIYNNTAATALNGTLIFSFMVVN